MNIALILLAGGRGTRMQTSAPKQFLPLAGKPIALHSFELFASLPEITQLIVVCPSEYRHLFPNAAFADPGAERIDSMKNGLAICDPLTQYVCIHDGARPLVTKENILKLISAGITHKAASLAIPAKNTIKTVNKELFVNQTLDRSTLWEMHTPQMLSINLLHKIPSTPVTDDVSLAELQDHPVKIIPDSPSNIKITTPEDLTIAEALLSSHKYKFTIAYDGTNYAGWQVQPNAATIQQLIEDALKVLFKTPIKITGSGRTDAGVHAHNQIAHCTLPRVNNLSKLRLSLNALIPHDIRIKAIEPVPNTFHARYSATSKTYHYHLHLSPVNNPFTSKYSTHITYPIDRQLLRDAAALFVGTHDFASFTNEGTPVEDTIRTIHSLDVIEEGDTIRLEFTGSGFLYKMVRNIVGTILSVARGKRPLDSIPSLFTARDRTQADEAAPPEGLFLTSVSYDPHSEEIKSEKRKDAKAQRI